MGNWREYLDTEPRNNVGRKINKERFCKKNKQGNNYYGPHVYENNHCKFCNKVDPQVKHRNYE